MEVKCEHCGKKTEEEYCCKVFIPHASEAPGIMTGRFIALCQIECAIAYLWKIKESRPKLSKSRIETPNTGGDPDPW